MVTAAGHGRVGRRNGAIQIGQVGLRATAGNAHFIGQPGNINRTTGRPRPHADAAHAQYPRANVVAGRTRSCTGAAGAGEGDRRVGNGKAQSRRQGVAQHDATLRQGTRIGQRESEIGAAAIGDGRTGKGLGHRRYADRERGVGRRAGQHHRPGRRRCRGHVHVGRRRRHTLRDRAGAAWHNRAAGETNTGAHVGTTAQRPTRTYQHRSRIVDQRAGVDVVNAHPGDVGHVGRRVGDRDHHARGATRANAGRGEGLGDRRWRIHIHRLEGHAVGEQGTDGGDISGGVGARTRGHTTNGQRNGTARSRRHVNVGGREGLRSVDGRECRRTTAGAGRYRRVGNLQARLQGVGKAQTATQYTARRRVGNGEDQCGGAVDGHIGRTKGLGEGRLYLYGETTRCHRIGNARDATDVGTTVIVRPAWRIASNINSDLAARHTTAQTGTGNGNDRRAGRGADGTGTRGARCRNVRRASDRHVCGQRIREVDARLRRVTSTVGDRER